jgi:DNA-binding MarR family transcriptional regulator
MKLEDEIKQTKPFRNEIQKLILNISFTSSWINTAMSAKLKSFDISPSQYNVLKILKGKHPKAYCNQDIVERMIDKASNVTRIVDKLEKKLLAIRTESVIDKRSVQITISDKGLELIERIEASLETSVSGLMAFDIAKAKLMNDWLDELREAKNI